MSGAHPSMRHMSSAGDLSAIPDMMGASLLPGPPGTQAQMGQYAQAAPGTFISPSMWQESVASVYEGGLKRGWAYDPGVGGLDPTGKRR